ncbi:hypothetical protein AB1Y20_010720 [Prymnesium parvum]|uniref:Uncharacterized protein n=1 Tax=Prymnesium parvum TaxID=97485 RepID=A0AB34IS62_PRYPA
MQTLHEVATAHGPISVRCWEPRAGAVRAYVAVTVHPWATLGGGEHNMVGIAEEMARHGVRTLTFDIRSNSMVWGVLTNHAVEVCQVKAVCAWAAARWSHPLLLLGSSAGAPIAGTVLPQLDAVVRFVAVGYTWGRFASIGFGRHFGSILRCEKPKLFIMGENDEFTSVHTLRAYMAKARGLPETKSVIIVPKVGHFELESPHYDSLVTSYILNWIK